MRIKWHHSKNRVSCSYYCFLLTRVIPLLVRLCSPSYFPLDSKKNPLSKLRGNIYFYRETRKEEGKRKRREEIKSYMEALVGRRSWKGITWKLYNEVGTLRDWSKSEMH